MPHFHAYDVRDSVKVSMLGQRSILIKPIHYEVLVTGCTYARRMHNGIKFKNGVDLPTPYTLPYPLNIAIEQLRYLRDPLSRETMEKMIMVCYVMMYRRGLPIAFETKYGQGGAFRNDRFLWHAFIHDAWMFLEIDVTLPDAIGEFLRFNSGYAPLCLDYNFEGQTMYGYYKRLELDVDVEGTIMDSYALKRLSSLPPSVKRARAQTLHGLNIYVPSVYRGDSEEFAHPIPPRLVNRPSRGRGNGRRGTPRKYSGFKGNGKE